jgi:hypothetical protein
MWPPCSPDRLGGRNSQHRKPSGEGGRDVTGPIRHPLGGHGDRVTSPPEGMQSPRARSDRGTPNQIRAKRERDLRRPILAAARPNRGWWPSRGSGGWRGKPFERRSAVPVAFRRCRIGPGTSLPPPPKGVLGGQARAAT